MTNAPSNERASAPQSDDPVHGVSLDECVYGNIDEGVEGSVVVVGDGKGRAAAQRRFADECGVRFGDVHSRTTWARLLTRQDAWERQGRERALDDAFFDLGFEHKTDWKRGMPFDAPEHRWIERDGAKVSEAEVDAACAEGAPERVPGDWQPDEYVWAWEECEPDAPGATKIWIFE